MILIENGLWFEEETGNAYSSKRSNGSTKGVTFDNPKKQLTGKNDKGYLCVRIDGRNKKWHRLVYEHFHGPIPKDMQVDHKNNIRDDNRICNLQLLSHKDNARHLKISPKNTSGLPGVYWHKKKWNAQIVIDCKRIYLGVFDDINEAYSVYYHAKILHHGPDSVRCYPDPTP